MADECTLILETEPAISFIAATTAIEKGAVMTMTSPLTAVLTTTDTAIVAGIAQSEKIAGDLAVATYRGGFFTGVAGVAGVTVGEAIITDASTSSTNRLVKADATSVNLLGMCLETAASGVRFAFELNPTTGGRAS